MSIISRFEEERHFRKGFQEYSTQYPNDYEYIDFSSDQTLYGRIDSDGDSIIIRESALDLLPESNDVWAANFVVDAFNDFRKYYLKAAYYNKIDVKSPGYLTAMKPKAGWISPTLLYHRHMEKIYLNFVGSYLKKRDRGKRIINFTNFMEVFMEYVQQLTPEINFTFSSFVQSTSCSPKTSGLIIELHGLNRNNYTNREELYSDKNYKFFRNAVRKFGFYVDKNAPWSIVANLNSVYKYKIKPFPSQAHLPDREEESGMMRYMKNYINDGMTVHNQLYFKTHIGDEWDELNGGDIILLRDYLYQFYNSFVASSPSILYTPSRCASINGHGTMMTVGGGNHDNPTYKLYREVLGLNGSNGALPDEFLERYGMKFWLLIYMKLRFAEANIKINVSKEYNEAMKIMHRQSWLHAISHINKRTIGHQRTNYNIVGGKKWHNKNPATEEDQTKRIKIQMPNGGYLETGGPLQTSPTQTFTPVDASSDPGIDPLPNVGLDTSY